MIKVLRLDDRLLHGQVALTWSKHYNIHTILIANDDVVTDEFLKMTLGLAKPMDVELKIDSMSDSIEYIKANEMSRQNVMVIVTNMVDAKKIIDSSEIKSLNVGNLRERAESVKYSMAVTLTPEDISICRQLIDAGIELEIRRIPDERKVLIKDIIK